MAGGESSGAAPVDIDELVSSMVVGIRYYLSVAEVNDSRKSSCLIPKIQKHIHVLERNAYEPIILSIGPYHYGNRSLQSSQKKKWSCLRYILHVNYNVQLHDYLDKIAELEIQARNCYVDEINMDSSEFLQMLLLDGCFLMVHLRGIDGTEICQSEIHAGGNPEKKDKYSTVKPDEKYVSEDTDFKEVIKKYGDKHANTNLETLEHNGTNSKGKDQLCGHEVVNSVDRFEQSQSSQRNDRDKFGDYGDGEWYYSYACHDILLLGNQIPFFVVKTIYRLYANTEDPNILTDNIGKFIESILHVYPKAIQESDRPKNFLHLLHLCHMYFSPTLQKEQYQTVIRPEFFQGLLGWVHRFMKASHQKEEKKQDFIFHNHFDSHHRSKVVIWRHAMQYYEAGIEFKRRSLNEHNPHSLLDISFHNGEIEIPFLFIDNITGPLFRNLIALEQTSPRLGNDFTAYTVFISQLISSPKDVSFLVKRGIIVHQMRSDEEVAVLFSQLTKTVDFDISGAYYLRSTCIAMEEHYQNRINRWMAWLWQNHFRNPWLSLAVLAAILVLVCTILQTLFAFLAYVDPIA